MKKKFAGISAITIAASVILSGCGENKQPTVHISSGLPLERNAYTICRCEYTFNDNNSLLVTIEGDTKEREGYSTRSYPLYNEDGKIVQYFSTYESKDSVSILILAFNSNDINSESFVGSGSVVINGEGEFHFEETVYLEDIPMVAELVLEFPA